MVKPSSKLPIAKHLTTYFKVSKKRACAVVSLSRSLWYYKGKKDDNLVVNKLSELAEQLPTRGFDEYYNRIRREGYKWNRKRVLRVYREMKLKLRRKHKKRIISRVKQPLLNPTTANICWSMDFMSDSLTDGRRIRVFNVIDDYNREALLVNAQIHYPAYTVIQRLEELAEQVGLPQYIRCDNGPEFISKRFTAWCEQHGIEIKYTQPGKPMQNGFVERFNRYYREDVLDAYYFNDIHQLNALSSKWQQDYNNNHPHKSLGYKSPKEYYKRTEIGFKSNLCSPIINQNIRI